MARAPLPSRGKPAISEDGYVDRATQVLRREYKNPPIVEAICGFRFDSASWNATTPGLMYEQVREDYPDTPDERSIVQASVSTDPAQAATQVSVGPVPQVAFKNGPRILSIAPQNLAVHSLAPYEGWGSLKPRALKALEAYRKIAPDARISGINLRYVNRVFIPQDRFQMGEYFTVVQALPTGGFPGSVTSFFDRMEYTYDDNHAIKIVFTWASDDSATVNSAFIMDFDLSLASEVDDKEVDSALEDLRQRERVAFESLIQDKLREIFDADPAA